jgi:carbamoylphosphate synthase small subunit
MDLIDTLAEGFKFKIETRNLGDIIRQQGSSRANIFQQVNPG